jgi:chromosome segregation ATPase
MKNLILLCVITLAVMFSGCNRNKIAQLEQENSDLRIEKHLADSLQNNFYDYLNEIESNLAEIKSKEKMISKATGEKPENVQQKIIQDLADISTLMDKNRERLNELESLRRKMKEANVNTQKMQEMITALETRVAEQEAQIKELQEQLRVANEKIDELKTENQQITEDNTKKQATIDEQTIALNTAYYTVGTSQALKEAGVITKKGGFIGLGKTQTINQEINLSNFTKVDIREFKKLETKSDKVEFITPHPTESYKLDETDPKNIVIEITNPTEFWKSSKYFVLRVR